jgi:hypothetical protein
MQRQTKAVETDITPHIINWFGHDRDGGRKQRADEAAAKKAAKARNGKQ